MGKGIWHRIMGPDARRQKLDDTIDGKKPKKAKAKPKASKNLSSNERLKRDVEDTFYGN